MEDNFSYSLESSGSMLPALKDSLMNDDAKGLAMEYLEIPIDLILENDALKGIPIVGTIAAVCKTGANLRERHYLKETLHFIVGFSERRLLPGEISAYEARISATEKSMEKELERVTLLLDSHIYSSQSHRLGKLYAAFRGYRITWNEFCELSEVNRRMYEVDFGVLAAIHEGKQGDYRDDYRASRLVSNGLIRDTGPTVTDGTLMLGQANYVCTSLGVKFLDCCL